MSGPGRKEAYHYCAELVRTSDKDRYLAALLAPFGARKHIVALYAFNSEIARIRDRANQPLAGEVRLQWWRNVISGSAQGDAGANPVAVALLDTMQRFELSREQLAALIEARTFDLYDEPMPNLDALNHYLQATSSALFHLASRITGVQVPVQTASRAGLAYGLTGLLRSFPFHASRGQIYLPADLLSRHGASGTEIVAGKNSAPLRAALKEMRSVARKYLQSVEKSKESHALLPLALVKPYLDQMERTDYDPFKTAVELSQIRRQWILWRAARKIP